MLTFLPVSSGIQLLYLMNPCATEYIKQIPLLQVKQEESPITQDYPQVNYLVRGEFITMRIATTPIVAPDRY
jgi:hypothetical protein